MGELAEDLAKAAPPDEIHAELADIWIISTALADQFLGVVAEPGGAYGRPGETRFALLELFAAATPVARIVNYYDGPKIPGSGEELGSLNEAVACLHGALGLLASALGADLARAVAGKLDRIGARDRGRFAPAGHDPSSATVLARFYETCPPHTTLGANARLWGAPESPDGDIGARARVIARDLVAFTRAAGPERIEGYVIGAPESAPAPVSWLHELLAAVGARQPPGALRDDWTGEEHELSFNGSRLVVCCPPAPGAPPGAGGQQLAVLRPAPRRGVR